jgi:hypothetical protein
LVHYRQSQRYDPNNPETYVNIGVILEAQK